MESSEGMDLLEIIRPRNLANAVYFEFAGPHGAREWLILLPHSQVGHLRETHSQHFQQNHQADS